MIAIILLAIGPSLVARSNDNRTVGHRLVHRFDFEESRLNNFEDLPMHWFIIGRRADTANPTFLRQPIHEQLSGQPNYHRHAEVRFDPPQQTQGPHRLMLQLNGGSVGVFLEVGALPAVPGSDYLITTVVQTTNLQHAGARLVAYFIDTTGHQIADSVVVSPATRTQGRTESLGVKLLGDFPNAAWIGLQLEVLQPQPKPHAVLGKHQVVYEDVRGQAWFDDVTIWQLPHLSVRSQSPINIIRAPEHPQLTMRVRDLTGQSLTAEVSVYDHQMRLIGRDQQRVGEGQPESWQWSPALDRFGWYLVDMIVYEAAMPHDTVTPVARTLSALLWLPMEPALTVADAQQFTIVATDLNARERSMIPELMDKTGLKSIVLSAWDRETTVIDIDQQQQRLDDLLQSLLVFENQIILSLYPPPDELIRTLDIPDDSPIFIFRRPRETWIPYLAPVLLRHGQHVRQWQLGSLDQPGVFFLRRWQPFIQSIYSHFLDLTPEPRLVLPWSLDQARDRARAVKPIHAIDVPIAVRPETIGEYAQEWLESPKQEYWLHLRVPTASQLSHAKRVEDLVLRMVHGREAQAHELMIPRCWTLNVDRHSSLLPDPLLGVFSSVAHRLRGRQAIGRMPVGPGLEAIIFDGPSGGMLVAWNRAADSKDAWLDMYFGPSPIVIDAWGNRDTPPLSDGRHRVALSSTPVFIEGIDPQLAMLRASFRLDPPFIESTTIPHRRDVSFVNPWHRTISGKMILTDPNRWNITPTHFHFSVPAGQKTTFPVTLQFPVYEEAGLKKIAARFEFLADQSYNVDLNTNFELGLADVELDASLTLEHNRETGQTDGIVTQLITYKGTEPRALYVFANMPGHPRQERLVANMQPGQAVVRRFRFTGVQSDGQNLKVRVGIREATGPAVLNQVLEADSL